MIASVSGTVAAVALDHVVVEVGGVGLLVHTTPADAASLVVGAQASLATTLVVREDALTLYGFGDGTQRDLFEQVQTVSGVGPRLALAMLAVHPPEVLRRAISGREIATLVKVPGIGKKGAERIVLELADKIAPTDGAATPASGGQPAAVSAEHDQVTEALVGLGWSVKQAQDALGKVAEADPQPPQEVSALLRAALRELGR